MKLEEAKTLYQGEWITFAPLYKVIIWKGGQSSTIKNAEHLIRDFL